MYSPKHGCSNAPDSTVEYRPMRALATRDQNLLDSTVIINKLSLYDDLGYFVTKCIHSNPCANDVHGLHYQKNV